MRISIDLIKKVQLEGNIKYLSSFLYFKNLYSNSCFYNPSIKNLAAKSNMSRNMVRKHLGVWSKSGWIRIHSNNIVFKKLTTVSNDGWKVDIRVDDISIKQIGVMLQSELLKRKSEQFNFKSKIANDLVNPMDCKSHVKAKRLARKHVINQSGESSNFKMSMSKIAEYLRVSKSQASNIIREMKKSGLVKVFNEGKLTLHSKVTKAMWKSSQEREEFKGCYYYKGFIVKNTCNEYIF